MALYYINRAILRNNAYSKKSKRGNVIEDDLPIFFKHQQDREANHMAAFTSKDPMIGIASLHTGTKFLRIGILLSKRSLSKIP
ncbi:hypothetical protein J6TS1_18640 [Siminovitchia terrae]|uniref:Uncharacterized protein n=1 Tax=Siminovitchia terrae TaxID=1914933 RepID=A0ABQ4KWH9_SIMTE|nr:hypothetical protein J6TS1_18640 [Siminovitchia terrae]